MEQVHVNLIKEEARYLLQKGAVSQLPEEQSETGFYSNLFLVSRKDGEQTPVINLKALDEFVIPVHFKMEGIHTFRDLIKPRDWLTKVDLKDACFAISNHTEWRRFLRFTVEGNAYQFNSLTFSLSSAPWVFTKTLEPAAALLQK